MSFFPACFSITALTWPRLVFARLLAGRGTRRSIVAASIALVGVGGLLDIGTILVAVVSVVGVKRRARVLRLLGVGVRGRRCLVLVVVVVAALLGVLLLRISRLLVVIVHFVLVVAAPFVAARSHPASAVDGCGALAAATTSEAARIKISRLQ